MKLHFRQTKIGEWSDGDWFEDMNIDIHVDDSLFFAVDTRKWFLTWVFKCSTS